MRRHNGAVTDDITDTIPRGAYVDRARAARYVSLAYPSPGVPQRVGTALMIGRQPGPRGLTLVDTGSSRTHARLGPAEGGPGAFGVQDLGSKNGTFVDGRRVQRAPLDANATLRMGNSLLVVSTVESGPSGRSPRPTLGESPRSALIRDAVARVAASDLPVLVRGPTGSGKERIARALHDRSGRSGRLVSVNCAALSPELLVSELFGHVRGAFSGADSARTGLFVAARGGTLFLDEIAELPLDQQPALLRALQEKRVRPVGGDHEVDVDVRVVAATHQDLAARVEDGRFRADLYARLAGVELAVAPLRERREEILPLFARFVGADVELTADAAEALLVYDWPFNVRELINVARAVRLELVEHRLGVQALPPKIRAAYTAVTRAPPDDQMSERAMLIDLLRTNDGNISAVARATEQSRQQLYRRIAALDIDPSDYRDPPS